MNLLMPATRIRNKLADADQKSRKDSWQYTFENENNLKDLINWAMNSECRWDNLSKIKKYDLQYKIFKSFLEILS